MLILLAACEPAVPDVEGEKQHQGRDSGDTAGFDSGDSADSADSAADPDPACDNIAALPVEEDYIPGFTGAEDFAFDADGYLVSIDQRGNLVRINQAGEQRVILPQVTMFGAGTRFLPSGEIVLCDAEKGNLVRIDPANPAANVVLSGLSYPNGLDVDLDGFVYVAEQNAGRVRRIDPYSGENSVVADGLYNPNGVSFSPDYQTLYVGSFGAGVVWAVARESETWAAPRVYATTPEAPGVPPDWCDTYGVGADCPTYAGYGLGECVDDNAGGSDCQQDLDVAACDGLAAGDACTTDRAGVSVSSVCFAQGESPLFCPYTSAEQIAACDGLAESARCSYSTGAGECYQSAQLVLSCLDTNDYYAAYQTACDGLTEGDRCTLQDGVYPSVGLCGDGAAWGLPGQICFPGGVAYSENGGIDGVNVDACENLYVTEYIQGKIWRFDDEGSEPNLVARVQSSWIPNMHWGNGFGGWERDVLYVMDRDQGGVFALPLGVEGHGDAWDPGAP